MVERWMRAKCAGSSRSSTTDAVQETLGLTDAQVQQLEALTAERQAEREKRRAEWPEPGAPRDELASVLTPEQQEIAAVHRALAVRLMRAHHRSGHGRG